MLWVELDPSQETLAATCLLQPDWMWAAQLDKSKDTAAQSAAVAGLAALRPITYLVVTALEHCLLDDQVYPRYGCLNLIFVVNVYQCLSFGLTWMHTFCRQENSMQATAS